MVVRRTMVVCGTMYKSHERNIFLVMHSECLIKRLPAFVVEFPGHFVLDLLKQLE